MPVLSNDILKDIFISIDKEEDEFCGKLKFALVGVECLNSFKATLCSVKSISLFADSLKISFNSNDWFFDYGENVIPSFVWKTIACHVPKLIVDEYSAEHHFQLLQDLIRHQNVKEVELYSTIPKHVMVMLLTPALKALKAPVDLLILLAQMNLKVELEALEVTLSNQASSLLYELLFDFCFDIKELSIAFDGEFIWNDIIDIFSIQLFEPISVFIETVKLNFGGFCDFPVMSKINLSQFFQSLLFRFPSLTAVELNIQPCDWLEAAYIIEKEEDMTFRGQLQKLAKYRLNASFFINLFEELSKQLIASDMGYEITVTWQGEASINSETSPEIDAFNQAFKPLLSCQDFDADEARWIITEEVAHNRTLVIDIDIKKLYSSSANDSITHPN